MNRSIALLATLALAGCSSGQDPNNITKVEKQQLCTSVFSILDKDQKISEEQLVIEDQLDKYDPSVPTADVRLAANTSLDENVANRQIWRKVCGQ